MPQSQIAGAIEALDHLVLTVRDIARTVRFYTEILGMEGRRFQVADGSQRWALYFGAQKINLHQTGQEFDPKAAHPSPGAADLCFVTRLSLDHWQAHLDRAKVPVEEGPVRRSGATGPILSVYIRDPDQNLIEIAQPLD